MTSNSCISLSRYSILLFIWITSSGAAAMYLLTDYFMDQSQSRAFLGVCGKTLKDESFYINSHVNTFHLAHYGNGRDCSVVLDAGEVRGARYSFKYVEWDLESAASNSQCNSDYLLVHDGARGNGTRFYAKYCGQNKPNRTSFPVGRYMTMRFVTDNQNTGTGFRILAVKQALPPCSENEFYCGSEDRCVDARLRCDGTAQCLDAADEHACTVWERFIGGLMSIGLAGMIGVGMGTFSLGLLLCLLCCCCCCKNHTRRGSSVHPGSRKRGGAQERWEEVLSNHETPHSQLQHDARVGRRNSFAPRDRLEELSTRERLEVMRETHREALKRPNLDKEQSPFPQPNWLK